MYYKEETLVKLKRVCPTKPNMCKLTVASNALNHFGYKSQFGELITPESLLNKINKKRKIEGKRTLNPDKHIIPSTELEKFSKKTGLLKVRTEFGKKMLDAKYVKNPIQTGHVIGVYHQMLYSYKAIMESKEILPFLVSEKYSHKKFLNFIDFVVSKIGPFEEGHVDLILDIVKKENSWHVVLANLNSKRNKHPIVLPWKFFTNFLFWEYSTVEKMTSGKRFPTNGKVKTLRSEGRVKSGVCEFYVGMSEIYFRSGNSQGSKISSA